MKEHQGEVHGRDFRCSAHVLRILENIKVEATSVSVGAIVSSPCFWLNIQTKGMFNPACQEVSQTNLLYALFMFSLNLPLEINELESIQMHNRLFKFGEVAGASSFNNDERS